MVHCLHTDLLHGNIQEQRHLQICTGPLRNSQPFQYVLNSIIQTVSYVLPGSYSARLQAKKVNIFLHASEWDGREAGRVLVQNALPWLQACLRPLQPALQQI